MYTLCWTVARSVFYKDKVRVTSRSTVCLCVYQPLNLAVEPQKTYYPFKGLVTLTTVKAPVRTAQ
jgi:hypothetical protein